MPVKITATVPAFLCLLALPPTGQAITEGPAGADASAPMTMTTAVPAAPTGLGPSAVNTKPHLDPEIQIRTALQHKLEGRPQEALGTLELAIASNPDNARLYAVRGSILLEQGRIAPALSDLEKAVTLDPDDAESLVDRGEAYRRFGRMDLASADLDRAVEINPDHVAARSNRGALRFGKQDHTGVLEDFDHCIGLDPELPGPYFSRALVRDALGERTLAMQDLERFLQIEQSKDLRKQARAILKLWRDPKHSKDRTEKVQPVPRP